MAVVYANAGGSETGGIERLANMTGAVTAQTSVNNGQAYAYKFDTGAGPTAAVGKSGLAVLAAAGNRVSVYTRFPVLPTSSTAASPLHVTPTGSGTGLLVVWIGTDGLLRLYTNGATTILGAAGATVLAVDTWYRITLSYAIVTTSNWSAKVYINGVLEMTRTNADGTLSSAVPTDIRHAANVGLGANWLFYVSDIYADNTTDQTDPATGIGNGELRVTNKLPTTNTTNSFDTVIGSGAVNERPVNTANGWRHNNTTDVDQDYDIQDAATGDANLTGATVVGSFGWIWATLGSLTGTPSTNIIFNGARETGTWDAATANVASLLISRTVARPGVRVAIRNNRLERRDNAVARVNLQCVEVRRGKHAIC